MVKKLIAILLGTTLYTIVRYVIFGHVPKVHIPVYLLNKSVSMASVVFLTFAAYNYSRQRVDRLRFWGAASLHCAYVHVLLSLTILSSAYYPKFFGAGKMNLTGECAMLLGVLSIYCFWMARNGKSFPARKGVLSILASLFIVGHLVAMGMSGWLDVAKWHGGLPPISLLSLGFALASLILFSRSRK